MSDKQPGNHALHLEARHILELLDRQHGSQGQRAHINTEPGGRPYFADHHADFNISHSKYAAAVAYTVRKSPETKLPLRTGCDIQYVDPIKARKEIARRFFSIQEQAYIAAGSDTPEQIRRFYHIWVLKECFLKAQGLSVFDMLQTPSFISGSILPLDFYTYELKDPIYGQYMLAAALEKVPSDMLAEDNQSDTPLLPKLYWFSQESLQIKRIALEPAAKLG